MIRRPPRSTLSSSSAASDVYKRQPPTRTVPGSGRMRRRRRSTRSSPPAGPPSRHRVQQRGQLSPSLRLQRLHRGAVTGDRGCDRGHVLRAQREHLRAATDAVGQRRGLAVSYTHLRAHETPEHLVCRLLLEKKKKHKQSQHLQPYHTTTKITKKHTKSHT